MEIPENEMDEEMWGSRAEYINNLYTAQHAVNCWLDAL